MGQRNTGVSARGLLLGSCVKSKVLLTYSYLQTMKILDFALYCTSKPPTKNADGVKWHTKCSKQWCMLVCQSYCLPVFVMSEDNYLFFENLSTCFRFWVIVSTCVSVLVSVRIRLSPCPPPPQVCLPPSMTSVDLLQSGECVHCWAHIL